ncbi:MAG: hypothetical protein HC838_00125 [Spirulinaceae cyanobacterium RM2_2_10]|nr:hypothetical protein [Spirulinaceae cyanobacterium RM2_2_10]
MKTKEDLKALRELANRATPGPWQSSNGFSFPGSCIEGVSKQFKVDVIVCDGTYDSKFNGVQRKNDAEFIVASRTAVPKLIDDIEELQKEIEVWKPRAEINGRIGFEAIDKQNELVTQLNKSLGRERMLRAALEGLMQYSPRFWGRPLITEFYEHWKRAEMALLASRAVEELEKE